MIHALLMERSVLHGFARCQLLYAAFLLVFWIRKFLHSWCTVTNKTFRQTGITCGMSWFAYLFGFRKNVCFCHWHCYFQGQVPFLTHTHTHMSRLWPKSPSKRHVTTSTHTLRFGTWSVVCGLCGGSGHNVKNCQIPGAEKYRQPLVSFLPSWNKFSMRGLFFSLP